jgi:molybdate transport system substrate-binding protein
LVFSNLMNTAIPLLGLCLFMGCRESSTPPLQIYAAASIAPVAEQLLKAFPQGYSYELNIASSSLLAQQISQGAPADIFLSASPQWTTFLQQSNTTHQVWEGLKNHLVLIKNKGATQSCVLEKSPPLVIADWTHVPAGVYAHKALTNLGLFDMQKQLISAVNVHAVLTYVARGDIPCGIVYKSDTLLSDDVEIVPSPLDTHDLDIRYSFLLLPRSTHPHVESIFTMLTDPIHKDLYTQFGFVYAGVHP